MATWPTPRARGRPWRPSDIYQRTKLEGEGRRARHCGPDRAPAHRGASGSVLRSRPTAGLLKLIGGVARRRFRPARRGHAALPDGVRGRSDRRISSGGRAAGAPGRTYILTGEEAPTLRELVQEIAAIARVPAPRVRLPVWPFWLAGRACEAVCVPSASSRRSTAGGSSSSPTTAGSTSPAPAPELGFAPRMPLREGLRRTLDSYRNLGWV